MSIVGIRGSEQQQQQQQQQPQRKVQKKGRTDKTSGYSTRLLLFLSITSFIIIIIIPLLRPFPASLYSCLSFRSSTSSIGSPTTSSTMVYSTRPTPGVNGGEKKLTPQEEKEWNHMADGMTYYHDHFKKSFAMIYQFADGSFERKGISLAQFLREAKSLDDHLDVHHKIEERHIFPILAKKMPQFKEGARESGEHIKSHKAIHKGLKQYSLLLSKYSSDPSSYNPEELRGNMDSWREVLFRHLDEEVHDLGAESMRKAGWTLDEVKRMPM